MTRREPDFHGQQISIQQKVAELMSCVTATMRCVTELLEIANNPRMSIIIDSPPMTDAQKRILEDLNEANRLEKERFRREAPEPGQWAVRRVEAVLEANNIPYRRLENLDYVLTDHVVSNDVRELFDENFRGSPYSVNGLVAGMVADLRKRPDLFKPRPPLSSTATEEARGKVADLGKPAAFSYGNTTIVSSTTDARPPWMPDEIPPLTRENMEQMTDPENVVIHSATFDGRTPMTSTAAGRKNERIPNGGGEQ